MAERVPIWYEGRSGRDTSVRAYPALENTAVRLYRELSLSIAIACRFQDDEISCVASSGPAAPPIGTVVAGKEGICAACVRQNRMQLTNDTVAGMALHPVCERQGIRSILVIPLRQGSRCFGFLAGFSEEANRFGPSLIERMRTEAQSIEDHVLRQRSRGFRLVSPLTISKREFDQPVPIFANYGESSKRWYQRANFLADGGRAISIAALASFVFLLAVTLPKVFHLKGAQLAKQQFATNSQPTAHSSQIETTTVELPDSVAERTLRQLRQLAELGDRRAQKALAGRYEQGNGVPHDRLKACVWYIMAGASGDAWAKERAVQLSHDLSQYQIAQIRFNVGKLYMQGVGASRDLIAAYSWFALAQAAGDIRAHLEQEKLESVMSKDQVSQALQRASDWLLAHHARGSRDTTVLAAISSHAHSGFKSIR